MHRWMECIVVALERSNEGRNLFIFLSVDVEDELYSRRGVEEEEEEEEMRVESGILY